MAKKDLFAEAQRSGVVAGDANLDDFTVEQLEGMIDPSKRAAWEGSLSSRTPQVAPDGHVNLSQEDIDAQAR